MSQTYEVSATCPDCQESRLIVASVTYDHERRCRPCSFARRSERPPQSATYSGIHAALKRVRGKASAYRCIKCANGAHEWALVATGDNLPRSQGGQAFSLNLDDYAPMCRGCHRRHDKAGITHCPRGHAYEGHNVLIDAGKRKCRTCHNARSRRRGRERTRQRGADDRERRNAYQRAYRARLKESGDAA